MEFGYNKNLRLYLRKKCSPNTGRKLGKCKKKYLRGYTEVGIVTTITHRKKNIDKPSHAEIWYLA